MDKQQAFALFIEQRTESLLDRVNDADQKITYESIRRLRVGIKRWRTLHKVITKLRPAHGKRKLIEQTVQGLFKRAGKVRDSQLNQQLVVRLDLPKKLEKKVCHLFRERQKKARKRLKKELESLHTKGIKKVGKSVEQLDVPITQARIAQQLSYFFDHEMRVIEALHQDEPSPEHMHMIRKHLKALIEVGNVIRVNTPDKSLTSLLKRAQTWQKRLGNWHDQVNLIAEVKSYLADHPKKFPPEKSRPLIDRLTTKATQQTDRIRHKIATLSQLLLLLGPWRTPTN